MQAAPNPESHVVVAQYATEREAHARALQYLALIDASYPIERRVEPGVTAGAIGETLAVEPGFGAYVYESPGHEVLKGRKRGFETRYFYAVRGAGPARTLP